MLYKLVKLVGEVCLVVVVKKLVVFVFVVVVLGLFMGDKKGGCGKVGW